MASHKLSILVVEDNLGDVLLIQEALNARAIAADVQVASDGETAMQRLGAMEPADVPQVIIIDLNLPRVNGMDLLRAVRSSEKFANTAVIVLTSSRSPQDKVATEKLGANLFISKPLTLDDFLRAVGEGIAKVISGPAARCRPLTARRERRPRSARRHERRRSEAPQCGWARAAGQV